MPSSVTEIRNDCRSCGTEIVVSSIPADLDPRWKTVISAPSLCSACIDREEEIEQRKRDDDQRRARIESSGLPRELRALRFEDFDGSGGRAAAAAGARQWAEGEIKGLLLCGPVGTGKTRLAATAAWTRLHDTPLRWISTPALIQHILASFDDLSRAEAIQTLTGTITLVLDDLDKVNPSEFVKAQLFCAIDARVSAGRPLLVTTNLAPSQIGKRLGEPIMSRLAGYCEAYQLEGRDRRLS